MKKLTYIISDIDKALAFEWIALDLKDKFDLKFILISKPPSHLAFFLKENKVSVLEINNNLGRLRKWFLIFWHLHKTKPDIIHTHLWQANLLGLSASWVLGIKERIYTRHHSAIHYDEFPSGRKWDILCNTLATKIVAISVNVQDILIKWDKASPAKVTLIHHGFDFKYFEAIGSERIVKLRKKYNLHDDDRPTVGVVSRFIHLKGIQYIIPAFKRFLHEYPSAKLILAGGIGNYEKEIKEMLGSLPGESFIEIPFENDLAALYKVFDLFVHVPITPYSEAFGQTYVEALIARVPSVFTLSGVAAEFVSHKKNAWVVDFKNSEQIAEGLISLAKDSTLRQSIIENGFDSIQGFSLTNFIYQLEKLYTDK